MLPSSESECGPLPTVTVTVTPSQVMLPVISAANPTSIVSYSALSSPDAPVAVGTSLGATTTESSTSFLTSTLVVNANSAAVPLPAQSDSAGYYYYTEDNGTTTWLAGKTPTSGAVYVTNTVVVTVQPQPVTRETSTIFAASQTTPSLQDGTSTSTVTLSSTDFYTHYLTEALTLQSASPSVPSTRLPPYIASNGWNATLSGVHRVKGSASAPALAGAASGSNPTSPRSGIVATTASRPFKRHHPRQIGAVVSATINGVVVSWVNSYGGEPATSVPLSSVQTSSSSVLLTSGSSTFRVTISANSVLTHDLQARSQLPHPNTHGTQAQRLGQAQSCNLRQGLFSCHPYHSSPVKLHLQHLVTLQQPLCIPARPALPLSLCLRRCRQSQVLLFSRLSSPHRHSLMQLTRVQLLLLQLPLLVVVIPASSRST